MVVEIVFESMKNALQTGDKIEIRGFGSFTVRERSPREARNPKNGEIVSIPAKKIPFFKTGKELRERVNNP
jgi:integration host factor subunit beta